jgi:four helix bundle protein
LGNWEIGKSGNWGAGLKETSAEVNLVMSDYNTFEDLECWKEARRLRRDISEFCKRLPPDEKYDLASQIRRSSRSVGANIAEGYGRYHFQENIQFCRHARGSRTETLDHLIVAYDENYLSEDVLQKFRQDIERCHRLLNGYIRYLNRQKSNQ